MSCLISGLSYEKNDEMHGNAARCFICSLGPFLPFSRLSFTLGQLLSTEFLTQNSGDFVAFRCLMCKSVRRRISKHLCIYRYEKIRMYKYDKIYMDLYRDFILKSIEGTGDM